MRLAVEVSDAAELAPKDASGSCNPFVEVELEDQRQRTATKPGDRSPSWKQTLLFDVRDPSRLPDLPIHVSVLHDRRLSEPHAARPHTFLGRLRISAASVAPSFDQAALHRYPLEKRGLFSRVSGDIALRLYLVADDDRPEHGGGEDRVDVRPGGADVVPVRERGEGSRPADDGHHGGAGPVRGGEGGQLQGRDAAPGEEPQPGVAAGVRLLPAAPAVERGGGDGEGQGRGEGRRGGARGAGHDRHPPPRAPRLPAGAAVVPPGGARRRQAAARRDHAGGVGGDAGGRGVPGGVALGRAHGVVAGGAERDALQGVLLAQAGVPEGVRHLGAGPAGEGPAGAGEDAAGRADPADAAAAGREPVVERGVFVRGRGAVRGAAGGDGGGAGGGGAGRGGGAGDHPGGAAVRGAQRRGEGGGVQVVQPVAGAVGGRGGGGGAGGPPARQGVEDVREQDPPAPQPGDVVPRAGRVDALQQRPAAGGEEAAQEQHRHPGAGHPGRAQPQGQARRALLRRQVRRQVGAHPHPARHPPPAVERAVHLGGVRPLHRAHRRRLRQRPGPRRRRGRGPGRARRQGARPAVDAGVGPGVHALLPADGADAGRAEQDRRAAPGAALHLHGLGQHAGHVRQAAAPQAALLPPHQRAAAGLPALPGHADGGGAAGARRAAAAARGGGVHAGRGLPHVQPAAEQGQLPAHHVAAVGRRGGGGVDGRHLPVEEPGDHRAGARAVPHPGVLPGAHPAHRLPLPLHDRRLELPAAAAEAGAHGHGAVVRGAGAGAPGRAGRGVRHLPHHQARRRGADAVRPAAQRGRARADGGGRPGHAGGARAGAAQLARPPRHRHLRRALPPRRRRALRHALPGGGRRAGALPAAPPAVPEQAALRPLQLLQAPPLQVRHDALSL